MADDITYPGLEQSEPILVAPKPDADRLQAQHDAYMAQISEHDPASHYYRRPDLAAKARSEAETAFKAMMLRAGVTPTPAPTPEVIAQQHHEEAFKLATMPKALVEEIDARIAEAGKTPKVDRDKTIAAFKKDLGERRWGQLANTVAMPSIPQRVYVEAEGERQFAELVKYAKIARPDLPEAALADEYTLKTLAAFGRYTLAEKANRPKPR